MKQKFDIAAMVVLNWEELKPSTFDRVFIAATLMAKAHFKKIDHSRDFTRREALQHVFNRITVDCDSHKRLSVSVASCLELFYKEVLMFSDKDTRIALRCFAKHFKDVADNYGKPLQEGPKKE